MLIAIRFLLLCIALLLLASPLPALAQQKAYVTAEQRPGSLKPHGVGGLFTEPNSLSIQPELPRNKRTGYSVGQLILADADAGKSIEFGWVVAPGVYPDDRPHLFIALRKPPKNTLCFIVPKGYPNPSSKYQPCPDNVWSGRLSPNKQPGDAVGETGKPMMYHVGHFAGAWWIQYGGEWIAWVSDSWWDGFVQGNVIQWYGEVTYATDPSVPMGNGLFGTNTGSASISNMFYEIMQSNKSIGRTAEATIKYETNACWWNANKESKNRKINSFRYGGPGGPGKCAVSVPAAPSDISVFMSTGGAGIGVRWSDNSNNDNGFDISYSPTQNIKTAQHTLADANELHSDWGLKYNKNGLVPGQSMCFQVRAYNSAGSSASTPWSCIVVP